ncbi:hypothetical protein Goari_016687, partial [Gossypium aridum]|nr:hypothetical protein [Gossypium aridum]
MHALKYFSKARKVLDFGGFDNKLLDENYLRCVDWIEDAARVLDIKVISDFITVLWNVWNSKNNKIFRGVEDDTKAYYSLVARDANGFVHGGRMGYMNKE